MFDKHSAYTPSFLSSFYVFATISRLPETKKNVFFVFYITSQSISLEEAHKVIVYGLKDSSRLLSCRLLVKIENDTIWHFVVHKTFCVCIYFTATRSLIKLNPREWIYE